MGKAWKNALAASVLLALAACGSSSRAPSANIPGGPPSERTSGQDRGGDDASEEDAPDEDAPEGMEGARPPNAGAPGRCPAGMVVVGDRFCIDRYEAAVVEVLPDGTTQPHPHYLSVAGKNVRAVSEPGLYPQGYISEIEAEDACASAGKRLCTYPEWKSACTGPAGTAFPYGEARRPGVCNDSGKSAVVAVFGAKAVAASPVSPIIAAANAPKRPAHATTKTRVAQATRTRPGRASAAKVARTAPTKTTKNAKKSVRKGATPRPRSTAKAGTPPSGVELNVWTQLNDARLGQVEGTLSRSGEHPDCANGWGVVDMVGNLHEWVATDPSTPRGTFAGGYYLDTSQNGDGCHYKTQAHAHDYHDYSTGFRCCADLDDGG